MSQWAGVWIGLWEGDWKGETGLELEELHGGVTRAPWKPRRSVGRRDLDAVEQAREAERLAHLEALRKFAEKQAEAAEAAARAAEQSEPRKPATPQTVLALRPDDSKDIATQRAARLEAKETARVVAAQALADAIALRQQLDDEAAEAFMAYLMAA